MVRPSVTAKTRDSQYELKTLKLSQNTLGTLRKPMVWSRPDSGLYDYHYEIGGLYYQPMISYCIEREEGGARRKVEVPDRLMSNYDKRAYQLTPDQCDYEGFLTMMYARKIKDANKKTVHCANEMYTKSKKNTELNLIRAASNYRDNYICQLQLQHTGNVAKERNLLQKASKIQDVESNLMRARSRSQEREVVDQEEQRMVTRRAHSQEKEIKRERYVNRDGRYGPGFVKITSAAEDESMKKWLSPMSTTSLDKEVDSTESSSVVTKTSRVVRTYSGELGGEEVIKKETSTDSSVNKKFLEAETMKDLLRVWKDDQKKNLIIVEEEDKKNDFKDTAYVQALKDVKHRVREAGKGPNELPHAEDMKYFFGDKKAEKIGVYTKAQIHTNMYTASRLPDFDVGYDTIRSLKDAIVSV